MASVNCDKTAARLRQRGVAAIEFALIFLVLFSVLYVLATFGAVFYTQQSVTRAAEEGARAAGIVTTPTSGDPRVLDAVYDSLANSLIVPASANSSVATRRSWIVSKVVVTVGPTPSSNASYIVTVSYPYDANPLLPKVSLINWMPGPLVSQSTIALQSS